MAKLVPSHETSPFWPVRQSGAWARPRAYQVEALAAIPRQGRSIVVLPCGAGKTLVGAIAASRLRSESNGAPNILLITYNREAVAQYVHNLVDNLEIPPFEIFEYTGNAAARKRGMSLTSGFKLTHFYMLTQSEPNKESAVYRNYLLTTKWDAVIVDEAHLAPASHFSVAICKILKNTRCAISLTATYVRASDKNMDHIFGFLGNVVYRLTWTHLERCAFIAKLHFMQVACALPPNWKTPWELCVAQDRLNVQMLPPSKLEAMLCIVRAHQAHGEIGLIFADGLVVVEEAVRTLRNELHQDWKAVVGETPAAEREQMFKELNDGNLPGLFFSRVGEASTDFRNPRIRYVIIVCSSGSSETQFAQRAGRVARTTYAPVANERDDEVALARRVAHQKHACVYDLFTVDTNEETWARERVRYIKDEGYVFQTRTSEQLFECVVPPVCAHRVPEAESLRLLQRLLAKAHDAHVQRRVNEALLEKQRQQRQETAVRAKRIGGMREGIMRDRIVQKERRGRQARMERHAEARRQEEDRVREEMGSAPSLQARARCGL